MYKCVAEADPGGFDAWLETAIDTYGVNAYNLVGGASSANQYAGPTIPDRARKLNARPHARTAADLARRHVKKGNEHETLVKRRTRHEVVHLAGDHDPEPPIGSLKEYGALCKSGRSRPSAWS